MPDKAKLGKRFVCFSCGCKFYDLNRPEATCPDCGADQTEAPARDIRALLANKGFLPSGFDADPKLSNDPEPAAKADDEEADSDSDSDSDDDDDLLTYKDNATESDDE